MSYLVLARKSRPQRFDEVVGQQAVVRTLQNALRQNRVPHALIFSGIRGTGKTTLARIMAKALNCEQGPTDEPCGTCQSCREIMAGGSVDLHEVDGASNRGIQEIRELKENIRFMPTAARFKIIIIDEVHMLTTEAFNALLKTLEEPPDHVYFMFATTELHRVPVTILSRCQRYELKRVSHRELQEHFARLAGQEGVNIEPAALNLVAREAGGSVRDGLSLLDQVFSYCGADVTAADVVEVLGLVSHEVITALGTALLEADLARALDSLEQVYTFGMDLKRFVNELLSWFRSLIVCRVSRRPEQLLDLPEDELQELVGIAGNYSPQSLFALFNLLLESLEKVTWSQQPRLALELAFIRAVQVGDVVGVPDLLARLDKVLAGVPAESLAAAVPRSAAAGRGNADLGPAVTAGRIMQPARQPVEQGKAEVSPPEQAPPAPARDAAPEKKATGKAAPAAAGDAPMAVPTPGKQEEGAPAGGETGPAPARSADAPAEKKDVRRHWDDFLAYVRERKPWMAAALSRASSVSRRGDRLIIQYDDAADCRLLKNRENIRPLTEFALDFFQESLTVKFHVPDSLACEIDPENGASPQQERRALANDPLVLAALEIFNGQVGDIRVGPRFRQSLATGQEDNKVPE
ncbi:MAG TPA: DNA polymerase III subunit gamma/tau [Desulfobulbus sp.]|nr:DNA polymerase III subunit gamma/tau [Desulfobulbus sp.]